MVIEEHSELFLYSIQKNKDSFEEAKKFVESLTADKGSTELWRVLQKLYMLPTLSTADHPRNIFLISDGHVTEEETTLSLIRSHCQSDRLFTFGVGSTANRYLLRAMSKVGAGASELFDDSAKSKWERRVKSQLSKAEQPGLTSVRVTWQQHDSGSSPPVQAPHQLLSLFNGSRQVVYGFVDNCTQATLTAEVNGTMVSTMVSTADLNITTGKILHQLTARAVIRDWDEGSLHEQRSGHEIVKRERKDYIISLSMKFSVVSKFTSFVAVEHREKDEKFGKGRRPSILELVSLEDVDILDYIAWEQRPVVEKNQELAVKVLSNLSTLKGEEEKARQMSSKSRDSYLSDSTEGSDSSGDSGENDECMDEVEEEEPEITEEISDGDDEVTYRGDVSIEGRMESPDVLRVENQSALYRPTSPGDADKEKIRCRAYERPSPPFISPFPRVALRRQFSAPKPEAAVNESKKTEKKLQGERSDDASLDVKLAASSVFKAALPTKKAAPFTFGGGIAQRAEISSGTDSFAEGFSLRRRGQIFGKPVKNGGLFGNTQGTSLFSQSLPTAADPVTRPFSLYQKKKKAIDEIPTTTEGEDAPPVVEGASDFGWQNMGMSKSAQTSGSFMFGQSQPPQRNPLNYPQTGGLFGNSQQTKMTDSPSPRFRVKQADRPTREEVLREIPVTREGGAVPLNLHSMVKQDTCPVPGDLHQPLPPPPAPPTSHAPLRLPYVGRTVTRSVFGEGVQREQLDYTRERREKLKRIFTAQNSEGFWNVDDLPIVGINTRAFTDLLASAGARSLGLKVFESVKRLLATFMMLAFIKLRLYVEFPLTLPFGRPESEVTVAGLGKEYSKDITKALKWIKIKERKIPLLYSRLEFGVNWEAATQTMAQKMKI